MSPIVITMDETINLPLNTFTRAGYTFMGWSTTASGAVIYGDGEEITMSSGADLDLYAIWKVNEYIITFNANGGHGTMAGQRINYQETEVLNLNLFMRVGYSFKGWSTTASGPVAYANGANYTMNTTSNVTLYAVWEANSYQVSFDANGGTGDNARFNSVDESIRNITFKSIHKSELSLLRLVEN